MEKIRFMPPDESEAVWFYVLEQTRIGGHDYILVTDSEEGDGNAYIMKDVSADGDEEASYRFVDDDGELSAVSGVFSEMMDDTDLV